MWKELLYQAWLLTKSEYVEPQRWVRMQHDNVPRVFYGYDALPASSDKAAGGIIKCQDLQKAFPNHPQGGNVLYLVSSALPVNAAHIVRHALRRGIKVVWNQNGVAYPGWHGPGWEKTNASMKVLLHRADYVIYQSRFCKESADKYLGTFARKSEILYNPVDTGVFVPAEKKKSGMRLLLAGSHHHFYRVQKVIEALPFLIADHPDLVLLIAGRYMWRASQEDALREATTLADRLGVRHHIEFSGAYSQMQAVKLFRKAHILIHSKYNDPCPRLVAEAMACGLPVVYSASGGVPELVGDTAGIGIPAPLDWEMDHPPQVEDICAAVLQIWANYSEYSRAARNRAETLLDVLPWLQRHEKIFNNILV